MRVIRRCCKEKGKTYPVRFQNQKNAEGEDKSDKESVVGLGSTQHLLARRRNKQKRFLVPVPGALVDDSRQEHWTLGRMLGRGGFARVYEAANKKDSSESCPIALKCVKRSSLTERQLEHWRVEVNIGKRLDHKHVVKYFGSFEDRSGFSCLKMMMCKKQTLMHLISRRRTITEGEATYFLRQAVAGLRYLHENRIIHRDIKLGNLFLDERMQVRIGDFGLAKRFPENMKPFARSVCGTPNYIAPEVVKKKRYSFKVDVWSLGCVLYALLCGRCPFQTNSIKLTYQFITDKPFQAKAGWSLDLLDLLKRMLAKDPNDRMDSNRLSKHPYLRNTAFDIPERVPSLIHYSEICIPRRQSTQD